MERLTGHAELQELLGAYALDAVEPEEAAAIERHLPTCPRCRNELADHREVAALLGYAGSAAPSGVWDRIVASLEEPPPALLLTLAATPPIGGHPQLRSVGPAISDPGTDPAFSAPGSSGDYDDTGERSGPQMPPPIHARSSHSHDNVVPIGPGRRRKTVEMRLMVALATAAAVVIGALGVQLGRVDARKPASTPNLAALAYRVADADPNARHLTLASADGVHTIRAVIIADGTTYLGPGNLATLPTDETYQMWGVVDGARVSLGVIGNNPTYHAFTTPTVANVIAMTVEPRGGVVTSTKAPVVVSVVPTA